MPAVIPIAAAVIGGAIAANSSKKASQAQADSARESSDAQAAAQRESMAFQQRQADQARADREPWRLAGSNALGQLVQRTGAGGDLSHQFGMSDFQTDPGYQFRMAEGQKALTNQFASRGNLLSGAAMKAAPAYSQNLASAEYGNAYNRFQTNQTNQFNRLASLADVGQVQANQNGSNAMSLGQNVGQGMMNTAQNVGNNMIGAGNARASGYLAQGNALTGAINQGVSSWNQYNAEKPNSGIPNTSNIQPRPY